MSSDWRKWVLITLGSLLVVVVAAIAVVLIADDEGPGSRPANQLKHGWLCGVVVMASKL